MKQTNYYKVLSHRVIDGDTIEVDLELPFGIRIHSNCRLRGIDAPERHNPSGKRLKEYLTYFLEDKELVCLYIKDDKFGGRFVGDLIFGEEDTLLTEYLLEQRLVKPYASGKRSLWTVEQNEAVLGNIQGLLSCPLKK